ncbi:MAG: hypothetical protein Q9P14_11565 [candidate division KSB1 bacterium]|nr:hypothetical protein [candidate division KSB1 bacterium]
MVDLLRTKRFWIVTMQLIIGAGLAGVALTLPTSNFFKYSLAFLWLLAFSSATHDIAADGFYMLGLNKHQQAWFVGIRSTFYRLAMITGQGLLVIMAGYIESITGLPTEKLQVRAVPQATEMRLLHPDSLRRRFDASELRMVVYPETLHIAIRPRSRAEADSLLALVKQWNHRSGTQTVQETRRQEQAAEQQPSRWQRHVSQPLERFLRRHFGPDLNERRASDRVGNLGFVYFYLSKQPEPGEEVVVNFGRDPATPASNWCSVHAWCSTPPTGTGRKSPSSSSTPN